MYNRGAKLLNLDSEKIGGLYTKTDICTLWDNYTCLKAG